MDEQFVPLNLAIELKELECNVKTFAYYDMQGKLYPMGTVVGPEEIYFGIFNPEFQYKPQLELLVSAPLWQQVFD